MVAIDRRAIYDRDLGVCGFCGQPVPFEQMDLDHITPRVQGGPTVPTNLRPSHPSCNRRHGVAHRSPRPSHSPAPAERMELRLDEATRHDLAQLAKRLNLTRPAVIRFVLREACERRQIAPLEVEPRAED